MTLADKFVQVVISVLQDSDELFTRNKRRKYSSARIEVLESLGRERCGLRSVMRMLARRRGPEDHIAIGFRISHVPCLQLLYW